jgi:hypothetical protein
MTYSFAMISLTKLRGLDLSAPPSPGRPLHLSAASGIVCVQSFIYVIADDELHLGVFRAADHGPGHPMRLFIGALPKSKARRKRRKPDLEALTLLPPFGLCRHGALLALGSGSTSNRRTGVLLELDAEGALYGPLRQIDLARIFAPLDDEFPALNVEGALVSGSEIFLLQRGNRRHPRNAIIRYSLPAFLHALDAGARAPVTPSGILSVELGQCGGVPFSFTDGAALPGGGMVITAIAEDTANSYDDGPCVGAAIGIIDNSGKLRSFDHLDTPHKIEGVHADEDGNAIRLMLVTDADDPDVPAGLFSATINLPPSS